MPKPPAATSGGFATLLRCYSYLRPRARVIVGAYSFMLLMDALVLVSPQLIRRMIDQGIAARRFDVLGGLVLALLGLTVVKGVMAFFQGRWLEQASQGVAFDMRNDIHAKLASLSFSYHDQVETGQLLSRAVQDVDRVRFLTGRATARILEGAVLAVGTCVVLVVMSPRLAILALLSLPLLVAAALRFGRQMRAVSAQTQNQLAVLTTRLEQNLRGARIVKAFAQEDAEMARFERENDRWLALAGRGARIQSVYAPLLVVIASIGTVVVMWYGGSLVIRGGLSLGALVAFSTYLGQLVQPVRMLGMIAPAITQASVAGRRVFEILDAQSEVKESPDAVALDGVKGRVEFQDVSFAYFNRFTVLSGVSFVAEPGQVIALLGATGSGKSTVINLIPRFYDVSGGRIMIDGHDIRSLTLASLRERIGIVLQETTLFALSVRENITFGTSGATEAAMIEAARQAQAHDFIMGLPQGYDTRVGERGVTLSGGQKQRVAIARALLLDPRILILDDATSSVDAGTEQLIQAALERLMEGRTTFVIAHRLSSIRRADVILVLDRGVIAARGTHDELLRSSPVYADIYYQQILKSEESAEEAG